MAIDTIRTIAPDVDDVARQAGCSIVGGWSCSCFLVNRDFKD